MVKRRTTRKNAHLPLWQICKGPWALFRETMAHVNLDIQVTSMWHSRVESKGYSVAYFDCIAAFEEPYCWTSVKGEAHTRFVDAWISNESTKQVWAPPLTNTALWTQRCNRSTRRNNLRFLHGLPHMHYIVTYVYTCPSKSDLLPIKKITWREEGNKQ